MNKLVNKSWDLIIIDESHRWVTGYPKRSAIWKDIKAITKDTPIIFSSGTLTPEGYSGLFNMLALSDYSPWAKYSRFTLWHQDYGRPYTMQINGYSVTKYDRTKEERILRKMKRYTVVITRKEAGHVHESEDHLELIPQTKKQKEMYHQLSEHLIYGDILADTPAKLMQKLHQISGGMVKDEDGAIVTLKKNPKLKWLRKNIDPEKTIILANYIAEQKMLEKEFPHTGSITKMCEGVDFSHFEHMIIYSMGFSAATYEQVRARQMNIYRKTPITITYLISGIDKHVYKAVHSKKSFTAAWFKRNKGTI